MIERTPQFDRTLARATQSAIMQARMQAFVPKEGGEAATAIQAVPPEDIPAAYNASMFSFEGARLSEQLLHYVQAAYPKYRPTVSGHFYYPPGGYMGWHTNSDVPCKHLYITVASGSGLSFFRYRDTNGEVITDFDSIGVNFREFDTTNTDPLFWHCVYSQCDRVSFGFRLHKK